MKVVCIKNDNFIYGCYCDLTIGETYYIIDISINGNYQIIDDTGYKHYFYKEWFKTVSELRNDKINKLLG